MSTTNHKMLGSPIGNPEAAYLLMIASSIMEVFLARETGPFV